MPAPGVPERLQVVWEPVIVAVEQRHPRLARCPHPGIARRARAAVDLVADYACAIGARRRLSVIVRTVVNNDDLGRLVRRLSQHALQSLPKQSGPVVSGDDDCERELRHVRLGGP